MDQSPPFNLEEILYNASFMPFTPQDQPLADSPTRSSPIFGDHNDILSDDSDVHKTPSSDSSPSSNISLNSLSLMSPSKSTQSPPQTPVKITQVNSKTPKRKPLPIVAERSKPPKSAKKSNIAIDCIVGMLYVKDGIFYVKIDFSNYYTIPMVVAAESLGLELIKFHALWLSTTEKQFMFKNMEWPYQKIVEIQKQIAELTQAEMILTRHENTTSYDSQRIIDINLKKAKLVDMIQSHQKVHVYIDIALYELGFNKALFYSW